MGLSWEFGERERGESEVGDCSRSGDTSGGLGIDSGLGEVLDWGAERAFWIIVKLRRGSGKDRQMNFCTSTGS